jgi:hypothetical protein
MILTTYKIDAHPNRRGQIEWALEHAHLNKTQDKLLRLLARRCNYKTGEVRANTRYTPSVRTLADRLAVTERTVQRNLTWADRQGWWHPDEREQRPGRVAGILDVPGDLMMPFWAECWTASAAAGR